MILIYLLFHQPPQTGVFLPTIVWMRKLRSGEVTRPPEAVDLLCRGKLEWLHVEPLRHWEQSDLSKVTQSWAFSHYQGELVNENS